MTEHEYELYVAFGNDGEIEASHDQETMLERWRENIDELGPVEVRLMKFVRRVPAVVPIVLQPTEMTVQI